MISFTKQSKLVAACGCFTYTLEWRDTAPEEHQERSRSTGPQVTLVLKMPKTSITLVWKTWISFGSFNSFFNSINYEMEEPGELKTIRKRILGSLNC